MTIRSEFTVHRLNADGMRKAEQLAEDFSALLDKLETLVPTTAGNGREQALVRTHMQLACFYAKRAMALHPANHEHTTVPA